MNLQDKIKHLSGARALISKRENWLQNRLYNYEGGFCAIGAVQQQLSLTGLVDYHPDNWGKLEVLTEELAISTDEIIEYDTRRTVVNYNNSRKHEEVLALFDNTISRLKRQETVENLIRIGNEPQLPCDVERSEEPPLGTDSKFELTV